MNEQNSILVIEDDSTLKQTLVHIFRRAGFNVVSADAGLNMLAILENLSYDLVLMDLSLIHDGCMSLFFKIKYLYPDLPIILLSSSLEQADIPCINEETAWKTIIKPFEPRYILNTTTEMIGAKINAI